MSPEAIDLAVKVLTFALSTCAMLVAWFRTRRKAVDEEIGKLGGRMQQLSEAGRERLDRHETQLHSLELTVRQMPGSQDMHKLQLDLARVVGSLDTMNANLAGQAEIMRRLEAVVSRHEDHLLDGGKR